jgi:CheY-like chemotaxis protein
MESDCAYSGANGIDLVKSRLKTNKPFYKIILTDINMPEMDGLQMSKQIKQLINKFCQKRAVSRKVKIYAVTAMNDSSIRNNYKAFGVEAIIQKPVQIA